MIGGLIELGGEILMTVSDGVTIQPYGILDDVKARAFTQPVLDEQVVIAAAADGYGNSLADASGFLQHPNVVPVTFTADHDVTLVALNGVITVVAGTALNYDASGDDVFDSFLVTCSYTYEVAGLPGDDTTVGSGQVTLWIARGEYATDQFDPTIQYPLNGTLYCGSDGKMTSRVNGPGLAMVTTPPTALHNELTMLWF